MGTLCEDSNLTIQRLNNLTAFSCYNILKPRKKEAE